MNCYELRKHLSAGHNIDLRGLHYELLVEIHTQEHRGVQGHYHDDPPQGDE